MKSMSRREQLAYMIGLFGSNSKATEDFAKQVGIKPSMHVGKPSEFFAADPDNRTAEWLMGQMIRTDEKVDPGLEFLASQSIVNVGKSYLNYDYGYKKGR